MPRWGAQAGRVALTSGLVLTITDGPDEDGSDVLIVVFTDLGIMATIESPCDVCEGKRFDQAVLEFKFGGRDISEVLAMPVAEAVEQAGADNMAGKLVLDTTNPLEFGPKGAHKPKENESLLKIADDETLLAGSVLLPVGKAHGDVRERMVESARSLKVGDGMLDGIDMGPLVTAER